MALGERIRDCRQRLQLSQEKLAEMMGVTRQAVTKWESDQSAPSTENLFKLAELFGTTTDFLLEVEKSQEKKPAVAETYCGKSCTGCQYQVQLSCPGCKKGPGRLWHGACAISRCCREKGHPSCQGCDLAARCANFKERARKPVIRLNKINEQLAQRKQMQESSEVLGAWLWILFWLVIPSSLASLLTSAAEAVPFLRIPGAVLSFVSALAAGWILLKLRNTSDHYRISGICQMIFACGSVMLTVLESVTSSSWVLLIQIPTAIIGAVAAYHEYTAHAYVLNRLAKVLPVPQAAELADKWETLWKWQIGLVAAMVSSIVLILILPGLGMLVLLAGLIGSPVTSILHLVYQYKTAKLFRTQQIE